MSPSVDITISGASKVSCLPKFENEVRRWVPELTECYPDVFDPSRPITVMLREDVDGLKAVAIKIDQTVLGAYKADKIQTTVYDMLMQSGRILRENLPALINRGLLS